MDLDELFMQRKMNKFGGYYLNGKPLSPEKRKEIVRQLNVGIGVTQIGRNLQISHGAVSKIAHIYRQTRSIEPRLRGSPYARKISSSSSENNGPRFTVKDNRPLRIRNNFTKDQIAVLLEYFEISPLPSQTRKEEISKKIGLTDKQITIWFNNRRSRIRNSRIKGIPLPSASETSSVKSVSDAQKLPSCNTSISSTQPPSKISLNIPDTYPLLSSYLSSPSSNVSATTLPSVVSSPSSPIFSLPQQFPLLSSPAILNYNSMLQFQQLLTAQYFLTTLMQQQMSQKR